MPVLRHESTTGCNRRTSSRPVARSSMRSKTYMPAYGDGRSCNAPLWISSNSRLMPATAVMSEMLRSLRRIAVRLGEVRKRARGGRRRRIYAVADTGSVTAVDHHCVQDVDCVVVEAAATTCRMWPRAERGLFDLEKGPVLCVWFANIDDQEVGEHEFGQRMRAVVVDGPVDVAVEAVPEGKVRVQTRPVRTRVGIGQVERVFHVVQVANLEVAVEGVELLRREHEILDLRPADPLQSNTQPTACQRLRDHAD